MRALLWIVLVATAVFAALNWPAFNTPQPLWLGFTTVTAPLGVLLLGALAVIALLVLLEQSMALAESRRHARELDAQRRLVDKAEGSRMAELRAWLTEEMGRAEQRSADARDVLLSRFDALERELRAELERRFGTRAAIDESIVRRDGPPPVLRR